MKVQEYLAAMIAVILHKSYGGLIKNRKLLNPQVIGFLTLPLYTVGTEDQFLARQETLIHGEW